VSGNIPVSGLFKMELQATTNINSPEIISCIILCDRILSEQLLYQDEKIDDYINIITTIIQNAVSGAKGALRLLCAGQNCNAMVLWRYLHEIECLLKVLIKYGENVAVKYIEHQKYFVLEYEFNKELDNDLKQNMLNDNAKSSERRNYINYGWLLSIKEFADKKDEKEYKLDFKNGLQKFAGLSNKYDVYAEASKIIHPSGKIFTVMPDYYYLFVINQVYESMSNISSEVIKFIEEYDLIEHEKFQAFKNMVTFDLSRLEENQKVISEKSKRLNWG